MKDFNRRGRPDKSRSFEGRGFHKRSFGGGDGGDREMFSATCASCGKECSVPFRPTGSRPVFCNDCFQKNSGEERPSRFDARPARTPRFEDGGNKKQFDELNAKLDKILSLLSGSSVEEE